MKRLFNHLTGVNVIRQDNQSTLSEKLFRLNKRFLTYFKHLLKIMFPKFLCLATLLFVFLLIVVVSLELLIYQVGLLSGKFYKLLSAKDLNAFGRLAALAIVMIIGNASLKSLSDFIASLLHITWRKYLTVYLNENYFKNKNFYYLQTKKIYQPVSRQANLQVYANETYIATPTVLSMDADVSSRRVGVDGIRNANENRSVSFDNPDQRITQDVDSMCNSLSNIIPIILISPFVIGYYAYNAFKTAGYYGPLAVFGYFLVGCILNGPLMSPIAAVVYLQDKLEGNFRYKHMSIRTHAESVAFYDSAHNELLQTNKIFDDLISILYRRNWKEFLLKMCVNILQYMGGILSYLILAIPIFAHLYDNLSPGELSQLISNYSFVCSYLVYLFTRLYNISNEVSIIAGNAHRVGQLIDLITKTDNQDSQSTDSNETRVLNQAETPDSRPASPLNDDVCLVVKNLCIKTPDKRKQLIKDLNFQFQANVNVLISGPSGCGKTSLFRVFSGLWKSYTGELYLAYTQFEPSNIFFLPQAPYFTNGSLIEQIIYPSTLTEFNSSQEVISKIEGWLQELNLDHLINKLNTCSIDSQENINWPTMLSLGEQQRLSFLRVLYHKPKFALLDEFTSSVDQETESIMYEFLRKLKITYLSIAHRDTVRKYHHIELKILKNGEYELINIENEHLSVNYCI